MFKQPFINWTSFEYCWNFVDNSNIYTSRASARPLNMAECKCKAWNQWAIYVHLNPKSPEPRCRHDPDTPHRDPRWNSQINPVKDTACAGGKNILTGWENRRGGSTLYRSADKILRKFTLFFRGHLPGPENAYYCLKVINFCENSLTALCFTLHFARSGATFGPTTIFLWSRILLGRCCDYFWAVLRGGDLSLFSAAVRLREPRREPQCSACWLPRLQWQGGGHLARLSQCSTINSGYIFSMI